MNYEQLVAEAVAQAETDMWAFQDVTVELADGQTAPIPDADLVLMGPGTVVYRLYRDGGLDVIASSAGTGMVDPASGEAFRVYL